MKLRAALMMAAVGGLALAGPALAAEPAKKPAPKADSKPKESIGSATMSEDGTIRLMLRATGGGAVGDALVVYAPTHKDYAMVLKHLGGMKPGETKPVAPFPDQEKKP